METTAIRNMQEKFKISEMYNSLFDIANLMAFLRTFGSYRIDIKNESAEFNKKIFIKSRDAQIDLFRELRKKQLVSYIDCEQSLNKKLVSFDIVSESKKYCCIFSDQMFKLFDGEEIIINKEDDILSVIFSEEEKIYIKEFLDCLTEALKNTLMFLDPLLYYPVTDKDWKMVTTVLEQSLEIIKTDLDLFYYFKAYYFLLCGSNRNHGTMLDEALLSSLKPEFKKLLIQLTFKKEELV